VFWKLYLGLADQEAAATRLILEYDKLNGFDQLYSADAAIYTKNRADEEKNLPAPIPSSVIIDTTSGHPGSTASPIASDWTAARSSGTPTGFPSTRKACNWEPARSPRSLPTTEAGTCPPTPKWPNSTPR
jgi:hypothetical protein